MNANDDAILEALDEADDELAVQKLQVAATISLAQAMEPSRGRLVSSPIQVSVSR